MGRGKGLTRASEYELITRTRIERADNYTTTKTSRTYPEVLVTTRLATHNKVGGCARCALCPFSNIHKRGIKFPTQSNEVCPSEDPRSDSSNLIFCFSP